MRHGYPRSCMILSLVLGSILAGCSGESGVKPVSIEARTKAAEQVVNAFLRDLRDEGLASLEPVIPQEDRASLASLKALLDKAPQRPNRLPFDYRLEPGSLQISAAESRGIPLGATIRRSAGKGDFTFRIINGGKMLVVNSAMTEPVTADNSPSQEIVGLPSDLGALEGALSAPDTLRKVTLAGSKPGAEIEMVIFFGLIGHPERLSKVLVEKRSYDEGTKQASFHLSVLEKPIQVEVLLDSGMSRVVALRSLDKKSPAAFFQDRIQSQTAE